VWCSVSGRVYIGIDPDTNGAMAVITEEGDFLEVFDADEEDGWEYLRRNRLVIALVTIEEQQAMNDPSPSRFGKLMRRFGQWEGAVIFAKIPMVLVKAKDWQAGIQGAAVSRAKKGQKRSAAAKAHLRKKRKEAICRYAQRRWPGATLLGPRGGILDGRSDALCIADYGRRTHGGQN